MVVRPKPVRGDERITVRRAESVYPMVDDRVANGDARGQRLKAYKG